MPSELDTVIEEMAKAKQYVDERLEKNGKVQKEEWGRIDKSVQEAVHALDILQKEKAARLAEDGRLRVRTGRLAGMDLFSLSIADSLAKRMYEKHGTCYNLVNEVAEERKKLRAGMNIEGHGVGRPSAPAHGCEDQGRHVLRAYPQMG